MQISKKLRISAHSALSLVEKIPEIMMSGGRLRIQMVVNSLKGTKAHVFCAFDFFFGQLFFCNTFSCEPVSVPSDYDNSGLL